MNYIKINSIPQNLQQLFKYVFKKHFPWKYELE